MENKYFYLIYNTIHINKQNFLSRKKQKKHFDKFQIQKKIHKNDTCKQLIIFNRRHVFKSRKQY